MKQQTSSIRSFLFRNNVTILFVVLCIGAFFLSGRSLPSLFDELFVRFGRNTFMVLSLIIPVVAGLGLNFSIIIGAIAGQIAIFLTVLWGGQGFLGILLCIAIAIPIAILFGYLMGRLFNSMKGTEMIGGMVAGFFSDGLYQFLFLFVMGGIIPIANQVLMSPSGVGVTNAIVLQDSIRHGLDNVPMLNILDFSFWACLAVVVLLTGYRFLKKRPLKLKQSLYVFVPLAIFYAASFIPAVQRFLSADRLGLLYATLIGLLAGAIYFIARIVLHIRKKGKNAGLPKKELLYLLLLAVGFGLTYVPVLEASLLNVDLPVLTYLVILGLCFAIKWFLNTKLGQNMRTIGHDRSVAASSGINVNRVRIIAMIITTSLASIGQIISLQNMGTMTTYGSHQQVALYSIAALLVGGASVQRATVRQALLGVFLFHTLFILAPNAGQNLLGDPQVGEFFRVFISFAVIALALAMHAWVSRSNKGATLSQPAAAKAE